MKLYRTHFNLSSHISLFPDLTCSELMWPKTLAVPYWGYSQGPIIPFDSPTDILRDVNLFSR